MQVINYDKEMDKIISELKKSGQRPKLLMHSCCAPCSSWCIERVKDYFDLAVYYYNPNIDTEEEYGLRLAEQKRLCESLGVKVIEEPHLKQEFLSKVKGLENLSEGGERCTVCFSLRLLKTAKRAKENGYEYFTTTLTVSPVKNAREINRIGKEIEKITGVKFLPSDFKKKGGFLKSIELSKKYSLYRQNYCGCEFSKSILPTE